MVCSLLQQLVNKKGKPTAAAGHWSCSCSSVAWAVRWVLDVLRPVCWWPRVEVVVIKIAYCSLGSNLRGLGTVFWWPFGHKIAKELYLESETFWLTVRWWCWILIFLLDIFYSNRGQCRTDNWFWHLCAPVSQCIWKVCVPLLRTRWLPVWPGTWAVRGAVVHICSSSFGEKRCVNNSPFIWVSPG